MKDSQITVLFMMAAIVFTGVLLMRKNALSLKAFIVVLAFLAVIGGFVFTTL